MGAVIDIFKKQFKAEKERRLEEKKNKGPLGTRILNGMRIWGLRLFLTIFMGLITYFTILFCTLIIPTIMGYVVGSFGFDFSNIGEVLLSLFSGLFFTAWLFVISYKALGFVGKKFIKGWKKAGEPIPPKTE